MKSTLFLNLPVLWIFHLFFIGGVSAKDIYVDNALGSNITNGTYSIAQRNSSGSDGNAYNTVQEGIDAMETGDVLMLRGGTYQEGHINMGDARSINGTAWTEGNFNTIKSYPGEWAILDGQNNISASRPAYGAVIGYSTFSSSDILSYWKFERLEIKNGSSADGTQAGGFFGWGGPFWFRYCYIHDNLATTSSNNPGGIKSHVLKESIIEYCRFEDNGLATGLYHNPGHIIIYSDYVEDPTNVIIADTAHKNIIRYNYFSGGMTGVKYKNSQWLSLSNDGTHFTYSDYGDKIHHNIFENMENYMIDGRQDFIQIYNNIFNNSTETEAKRVGIGESSSGDREPFFACVYNNTFIKTRVGVWRDNDYGDNSSYSYTLGINPHFYFYNNLIESVSNISGLLPLSIVFNYSSWDITDVEMSKVTVENNLFVPNTSTDEIITVGDNMDDFSAGTYENNDYSDVVYTNTSTSGLRSGYITNGEYVVETGVSILSGGIGGNHPYLSGVVIPSYIGATNPDDNSWVDGLLTDLTSTAWLRETLGRDDDDKPTWIEGTNVSHTNIQIPQDFKSSE